MKVDNFRAECQICNRPDPLALYKGVSFASHRKGDPVPEFIHTELSTGGLNAWMNRHIYNHHIEMLRFGPVLFTEVFRIFKP